MLGSELGGGTLEKIFNCSEINEKLLLHERELAWRDRLLQVMERFNIDDELGASHSRNIQERLVAHLFSIDWQFTS
ncbi:hypothetical protein DPMN_189971 [Dreissena polymorpha]|uniref:Uncharacterized protein n=1 Tax=Dreissena polymorpha TaxID=45954 RepID=A0A9D4DVA7_DREPO|nr:hypothetical protein DPMN_189971 [Dreissena polymorpha]